MCSLFLEADCLGVSFYIFFQHEYAVLCRSAEKYHLKLAQSRQTIPSLLLLLFSLLPCSVCFAHSFFFCLFCLKKMILLLFLFFLFLPFSCLLRFRNVIMSLSHWIGHIFRGKGQGSQSELWRQGAKWLVALPILSFYFWEFQKRSPVAVCRRVLCLGAALPGGKINYVCTSLVSR